MNVYEVNALLVEASRLDARMKRTNPVDQADMAESWARLLADVAPAAAAWALDQHYKSSRDTITVADIRSLADQYDDGVPNATSIRERGERDLWLLNHGIDPNEWDRRIAAGQKPIRILADFAVDVKEITA